VVGKRDQRLVYSKEFESLPFKNVDGRNEKNAVRIAVKEEQEEKVILCYSATRASKEKAIFSKAEQYYLEDLTKLKRRIETGKLNREDRCDSHVFITVLAYRLLASPRRNKKLENY